MIFGHVLAKHTSQPQFWVRGGAQQNHQHSHWRVQPNERIQINFVFEFWVFKSSNLKFPQQTQTRLHGKLNLLLGVGRTEVICRRRSFSTPWASLAGRRLIVFKCFLTDSIASWLDTCSKDLHKLLLGAPC